MNQIKRVKSSDVMTFYAEIDILWQINQVWIFF